MKKILEERKMYAKVIAKAWRDEEFKKRLLNDPATVLKENGIEIPEEMTVRFVERKEGEIVVPLPPPRPEFGELSEEDLEKVAGGNVGFPYQSGGPLDSWDWR
jgi:hypothetical protein